MRKRSGALHSETEEQFLLLAELTHEKNGYFYDESLHSTLSKEAKSRKKHSPRKQSEAVIPNFQGFEFGTGNQEREQQLKELGSPNQATVVNVTVICSKQQQMSHLLSQLWPETNCTCPEPCQRTINLCIVRDPRQAHICFKFWILEADSAMDPLYSTYLSKSWKVLNFSGQNQLGEPHSAEQSRAVLISLVGQYNK